MATLTASSFHSKVVTNAPPGLNAIYATFNAGNSTVSQGDVILLAKIPARCKVIEFIEDHTSPASVAAAFDFGLPAADLGANSVGATSAIATALAKGTVNRANVTKRLPIQVNSTANDREYSIVKALYKSVTGTVSTVIRATIIIEPNNDQDVG